MVDCSAVRHWRFVCRYHGHVGSEGKGQVSGVKDTEAGGKGQVQGCSRTSQEKRQTRRGEKRKGTDNTGLEQLTWREGLELQ